MGFIGWIATGVVIGILIGALMKVFAKKNNLGLLDHLQNYLSAGS
ncbi:hypothetical protein [Providencia stuartii]|nr:hypothetical protein [Providencia stuartii]